MIPFSEWRPDMPQLSQWAREALNVVPAEESYRPLNALSGVSNALNARCQGAEWFRGTSGLVKMFAGDTSKLYLLSGTTWSDVSRASGGGWSRIARTVLRASLSSRLISRWLCPCARNTCTLEQISMGIIRD